MSEKMNLTENGTKVRITHTSSMISQTTKRWNAEVKTTCRIATVISMADGSATTTLDQIKDSVRSAQKRTTVMTGDFHKWEHKTATNTASVSEATHSLQSINKYDIGKLDVSK